VKPVFDSVGVFISNVLMRHGVYLSELLGIPLSLRRPVVFLDILFPILLHFMLDLIIPLFGVICAILLTIMLTHVLIMHALLNMTLHYPGPMLILS